MIFHEVEIVCKRIRPEGDGYVDREEEEEEEEGEEEGGNRAK